MESFTYREFDAFKESVGDIDCTMTLRNATLNRWSIDHTEINNIHVQVGRLGSGNIVEGQSRSDGFLLYFPLSDRTEYSANGKVLQKNSFVVFEPGCEFCLSTKVEHDWFSIFLPTHMIARSDLVETLSNSGKAMCRLSSTNQQVSNQISSLVSRIFTATASCPSIESSPASKTIEAELLKVASLPTEKRQAGKPNTTGRTRISRRNIINQAMKLLEKRVGAPVSIGKLPEAIGVSERTLRTAFYEYFGVGPARYLQLRKLNQIYRVLLAADPNATSVTDVLIQHGEWEFGRLASRYRQLFGELPSETLQKIKK